LAVQGSSLKTLQTDHSYQFR